MAAQNCRGAEHPRTDTPLSSVQPFNVLRYDAGQHYDSHYDVFDPESYGPQTSQRVRTVMSPLPPLLARAETPIGASRHRVCLQMATVLLYLSRCGGGG